MVRKSIPFLLSPLYPYPYPFLPYQKKTKGVTPTGSSFYSPLLTSKLRYGKEGRSKGILLLPLWGTSKSKKYGKESKKSMVKRVRRSIPSYPLYQKKRPLLTSKLRYGKEGKKG